MARAPLRGGLLRLAARLSAWPFFGGIVSGMLRKDAQLGRLKEVTLSPRDRPAGELRPLGPTEARR